MFFEPINQYISNHELGITGLSGFLANFSRG
jgi:hypothetical protein